MSNLPITVSILASQSPDALAAERPHVTVEAEYGDAVVEGSILTMAHHGPRAGQMAPCAYGADVSALVERALTGDKLVIGLSHFDLDSLGGVMAVLGDKPGSVHFWALAEFVDVRGPHRVDEWVKVQRHPGVALLAVRQLRAFWAWSKEHRCDLRGGKVVDVTAHVRDAMGAIKRIFDGDEAMLAAGARMEEAEAALNNESFDHVFAGRRYKVVGRVHDTFVNHLYKLPQGGVADACVSYNPKTGAIVVSFADEDSPNACHIVQRRWGKLAGGHRGIAGSPRDQKMSKGELGLTVLDVLLTLEERDLSLEELDALRAKEGA